VHAETILILLFSVAAAVAIAVRQLQVPYTVALVLTGLGLGMLNLFTPPHLTKELLFSVFLPGLLFEAAFHIEFREFWRNRLAIASLAVPGVAAAVALTTVILTDRPGGESRCLISFLEGDSGRLSGFHGGPGPGDFPGVRSVAQDPGEDSVAVERGADLGRLAGRFAHGAGAQSGQGFSPS